VAAKNSITRAKNLTSLLVKWQRTLRLQDWILEAKFSDAALIDKGNAHGQTLLKEDNTKRAEILISDNPDTEVELTLVHELLHLHFDAVCFKDNSHKFWQFEQGLDMIAYTLIELEKKKAKR